MRVLSGIQPSGTMHIGNYLGALRQWVAVQDADAFYCVVDLHALTLDIDPDELRETTLDNLAALVASGLDPERCTIFVQSHNQYHARLSWLLECVANFGELSRMTQFKEKSSRQAGYRAGLFTYPVLMAADILLYETAEVPVGDDQRQHLELTREVAERFNRRYGETFVVPKAVVPPHSARVMDLQEPTRKMSKSVSSPQGSLFLMDTDADIERKIKRAVTDTDGEVRPDWDAKPGLTNLLEMYAAISGETPAKVASRYTQYGELKSDLAGLVVETLAPIQARYREVRADPAGLTAMATAGATRAEAVAALVYERAARAMGL
ncbi:MAG TPA: tryptophan--tRNA ligase [Acidimicrobiales bacterium]|nr:tryptophan--tRNA ligase [Acidimicrobiales bacterium]